MILKDDEFADLPTPQGPMRTYLFRPAANGCYPGIVLYSFGVQCPDARVAGSFHDLAFCAIVVHEHFHSQEP